MPNFKDYTGQRFGRLTVISMEMRQGSPYLAQKRQIAHAICLCDCGKQTAVTPSSLKRSKGATQSCGCLHRENSRQRMIAYTSEFPSFKNDLAGRRFGRLTVVACHTRQPASKWLCCCDCGEETVVARGSLLNGTTSSCGCYRRELKTIHGNTQAFGKRQLSGAYVSWIAMKLRCLYPTSDHYPAYGGRGIKICTRWLIFKNFLEDMGPRPLGHTIERIDVDGNYEPSNCKWLPRSEQHKNTQRTRANLMSWMLITGLCARCQKTFAFNPLRVPSIRRTSESPREPICRDCIFWANIERPKRGLPVIEVASDAYEPIDEVEL